MGKYECRLSFHIRRASASNEKETRKIKKTEQKNVCAMFAKR